MAPALKLEQRHWARLAVVAVVLVLFLLITVDDWGRDFVAHDATIAVNEVNDAELVGRTRRRSTAELVEASRMAAYRIRNWSYVGTAEEGNRTKVLFVRQNRLLRLKDDITVEIEDQGRYREVRVESRARLGLGDLGRNPRNVRRFYAELHTVLKGAARSPMLSPPQELGSS